MIDSLADSLARIPRNRGSAIFEHQRVDPSDGRASSLGKRWEIVGLFTLFPIIEDPYDAYVLQRSQVLGDALIYWLNLVAKPVGS